MGFDGADNSVRKARSRASLRPTSNVLFLLRNRKVRAPRGVASKVLPACLQDTLCGVNFTLELQSSPPGFFLCPCGHGGIHLGKWRGGGAADAFIVAVCWSAKTMPHEQQEGMQLWLWKVALLAALCFSAKAFLYS